MTIFENSIAQTDTTLPKAVMNAELNWFHVFKGMIDNELAKLGPDAFAVYCVVKSHCNLTTGVAFPSIATIAKKAGISERQVMRKIKTLEMHGYISKSRAGGHNKYQLREKLPIKDEEGRHNATASWGYQPSRIREVLDELKGMLRSGALIGQTIQIEQLQIIQKENNLSLQIGDLHSQELEHRNPVLYGRLMSLRSKRQKHKEIDG